MVRDALNPSLPEASRWSDEVMYGGGARRRRSLRSTVATLKRAVLRSAVTAAASASLLRT